MKMKFTAILVAGTWQDVEKSALDREWQRDDGAGGLWRKSDGQVVKGVVHRNQLMGLSPVTEVYFGRFVAGVNNALLAEVMRQLEMGRLQYGPGAQEAKP